MTTSSWFDTNKTMIYSIRDKISMVKQQQMVRHQVWSGHIGMCAAMEWSYWAVSGNPGVVT